MNTLDDLELVRNTLELLNEIRVSAETIQELRSDVCKEIYYSSKNVSTQLQKHQAKFMKVLNQPGLNINRSYDI